MYTLRTKRHFDAGHFLRDYDGKCANKHGHRWDFEVVIEGDELDKLGMLVDFTIVKGAMKKVEDMFDHTFLNDLPAFIIQNPTAENIARVIYKYIASYFKLVELPGRLKEVTVWEAPESCVTYSE